VYQVTVSYCLLLDGITACVQMLYQLLMLVYIMEHKPEQRYKMKGTTDARFEALSAVLMEFPV